MRWVWANRFRLKGPGTFKDKTAGLQSIAVTLAVLIGGAWTLYTFWTLGIKNRSELELTEELDEVTKQSLERGFVNITVDAKQIHLPGSDAPWVGGTYLGPHQSGLERTSS